MQQRCEGVVDRYSDYVTFARALMDTRGGPDPLLAEQGIFGSPRPATRETSMINVQRARASGDPYLVGIALESNVKFLGEQIDRAFENGKNHRLLRMAASSVFCEITDTCQNQMLVMIPCATVNHCYSDYREFLRADIDPEMRQLYDKARTALLGMVDR